MKDSDRPARLILADQSSRQLLEFDRIELPSTATSAAAAVRLSWGTGEFLASGPPTIDSMTVRADGALGDVSFPRGALRRVEAPYHGAARLIEAFGPLGPEWTTSGKPSADAGRFVSPAASLRLTHGADSLERPVSPPVAAGELQLWVDDELTGAGRRWTVSCFFGDKTTIRIGRSAGKKVQASSVGEPKLSLHEAPWRPGWRRLRLTFSSRSVAVSLDDAALAWSFDQGVAGPLTKVRLELQGEASGGAGDVRFDDLSIVEAHRSPGSEIADPAQARLTDVEGDRWFGALIGSDPKGASFRLPTGAVFLTPWNRLRSLDLPTSAAATPLEWTGEIGWASIVGAGDLIVSLESIDGQRWKMSHPLLGALQAPADRMRSWTPLVLGRRIELSAGPHHLGDKLASEFERPMPDGTSLRTEFPLQSLPGACRLRLAVQGMEGTGPLAPFAARLRAGALRSEVWINGKNVDYLNRHIARRSSEPTPLTVDLPTSALRVGRNTLEIRQTPDQKSGAFDEAEVSQLSLELSLPGEPTK